MGSSETASAHGPPGPFDAFEGIDARPVGEAVEMLVAALGTAEGDAGVVELLQSTARKDTLLASLPLDAVAALAARLTARLPGDLPAIEDRRLAWGLLDLLRRPSLQRRLVADGAAPWAERILALVERSHLTVGPLFRARAAAYGSRPLFEAPHRTGNRTLNWRQSAGRISAMARGLLALEGGSPAGPVALLSENRIEAALLDLACLSSGIRNVVVPANATDADVAYMLGHSRAGSVVVSTPEQLRKVVDRREALPDLRRIVLMDQDATAPKGVLGLEAMIALGSGIPEAELERRSEAVRIDDVATVMYTSGTTGSPKGIQFTHRNLVTKRFMRALALPELGEEDVFLCYLPLYHTFGRFLEMLGCVFWGATYCFLDNPSVEALVQGMRRFRPTVFISVPRKWIQLQQAIGHATDLETAADAQILAATRQTTGGRLRWGLSAAGHLDAEVFRFFQRQGIELMSGFGMTEATGGITMTPPGRYKDDSLGPPLPGIEVRLAEDGEMLVRGPYVAGYVDASDVASAVDPDGWLRTGDLMEQDADGFVRLVDRKKEIYKNIKGETIAPQRVETLFRDFESVGRVFLVGDHREYNTALIWPNPACRDLDLTRLSSDEVKGHLRSLVVSVNKFLAPYERIVDFAVIDRDLDPGQGELTAKGTPRRRTVERNFADVIRLLYRRTNLSVGGAELTFPNWLFQALGLTAQDIQVGDGVLTLPSTGTSLRVKRLPAGETQVGSALYGHLPGPLNLGSLLTTPRLWLGNDALVGFTSLDLAARERLGREAERIEWRGRPAPFGPQPEHAGRVAAALAAPAPDLMDLHAAALLLDGPEEERALAALRLMEKTLREPEGPLAEAARMLLGRTAESASLDVRRRAFQLLAPAERPSRFAGTLERFLRRPGLLLDGPTRAALCEPDLPEQKLEAFLDATRKACAGREVGRERERRAASLLTLLADYGALHPTRFRKLRAFLVRTMLFAEREPVRKEASRAVAALQNGFRKWLDPTLRVAVDPETGQEYRWEDVVVFEEGLDEGHRGRLLSAIKDTAFLREATFLFSGAAIRLSDIPPGGVWIRLLGTRHGKSVYRITVQTRFQGACDLAANVNHGLSEQEVQEELRWLVLCGEPGDREPLVEDFGGYWAEHDLWSEEFISGETLDRVLRRFSRRQEDHEKLRLIWPFFSISALSAYVDFWNRTGRRCEVASPGPADVIVPTHDYHTGARLVSVTQRQAHEGLVPMFLRLREHFVQPVELLHPFLAGMADWDTIFSALLEIVGSDEGSEMLRRAAREEAMPPPMRDSLERYLAKVEGRGFLPMRLFFAAKRYRRWNELIADPTPSARARTLHELYETYGLQKLAQAYPEARVRFYRETVFKDAPAPLAEGLETIIGRLRRGELPGDHLVDAIADLRSGVELGAADDYFLARLSFPYLRPEDSAGFVQAELGGKHGSEIVVTLEDQEGNPYFVRHALNPKEVGRLHRLFLAAKLDVRFRPEHQYLVAIHERGQIIGGIYYDVEEGGRAAHLEKIVVAERWRKKGVADGLMTEFLNRLRAAGVKTVTTGFFRPEYFYAYGFAIEKRYAGLVKSLELEEG